MEGLKLLNKSEEDLEHEIKIVQAISNIINMNFRLQKCTKICFKMSRGQHTQETQLKMALKNWTQGKHANI
jgi:hypothetical protein